MKTKETKMSGKKTSKKSTKEQIPEEVLAAIFMALAESGRRASASLTMQASLSEYKPWGSKILMMRKTPNRNLF